MKTHRPKQDPAPAYRKAHAEALALAERIVGALNQAEPKAVLWGHVGTMSAACERLKSIAAMLEPQG